MRIFLFILLSVVFAAVTPVWGQDEAAFDATTTLSENEQMAFIGQLISEKLDPKYQKPISGCRIDENGEEKCNFYLHVKDRYQTRYKVLRGISNIETGAVVDFHSYAEYGPPNSNGVAAPEFVILSTWKDKSGSSVLGRNYGFKKVYLTSDGDWAACGSKRELNIKNPDFSPRLEKLSFSVEAKINVEKMYMKLDENADGQISKTEDKRRDRVNSRNAYIDKQFELPIWKREGVFAYCQMGTRVSDLFRRERNNFLHNRRRELCNIEMGESPNVFVGTGSSPDAKEKGKIHEICVERLEFQNLP